MTLQQEVRHESAVRPWLGVAAITASLFVFLTTELMPVGLLTPISAGLDISVGAAGLMVTLMGGCRPDWECRSSWRGPGGSTGACCWRRCSRC
ncbi:hypothetical protein [Nonomuraea salmonea]|uniref:hypothetical protein n=1 Tax=Nonomuraea salmonea TaxID=46181 RepID=UPI0031E58740